MPAVLRGLAAVVMGLVVAFVITFAVEAVNTVIHPFPPGVDIHDPAAMKAAMLALPPAALALVLVGWLLSAVAGAWVATRIDRGGYKPALVVGFLLSASAVGNMLTIPHPVWFWVVAVVIYPVATWLGARWGGAPITRAG